MYDRWVGLAALLAVVTGCGSDEVAVDDVVGQTTATAAGTGPESGHPPARPTSTPAPATPPTSAPMATVDAISGLDVDALHQLEDDLKARVFDPATQIPVVQTALDHVRTATWPADIDVSDLDEALDHLLTALNDGDVAAATLAAGVVHDVAHDIQPH